MIRQIAERVIAAVRAAVPVHYNIRARYQSLYSRMATMRHAPFRCTENPNPDIMAIKRADECVRFNGFSGEERP